MIDHLNPSGTVENTFTVTNLRKLLAASLLSAACSSPVEPQPEVDSGFSIPGVPLYTCTTQRALEDGGQEELLGIRPIVARDSQVSCEPVPQAPLHCPHFESRDGTLWITNYPLEQARARFWPPDCPNIFTLSRQDPCRMWYMSYPPVADGSINDTAQISSVYDTYRASVDAGCSSGSLGLLDSINGGNGHLQPLDRSTSPSLSATLGDAGLDDKNINTLDGSLEQ